jgi:hypothetical protein
MLFLEEAQGSILRALAPPAWTRLHPQAYGTGTQPVQGGRKMPNILKDSLCGEGFSGREANRRATDRNKHGPFFFFFFPVDFLQLSTVLDLDGIQTFALSLAFPQIFKK